MLLLLDDTQPIWKQELRVERHYCS